ncbi:hypothetical protein [Prosthecobacter sp.]|uniref:hypothetical protein n=1 Tax=Prosthecobacter sp. TaxID=1965333 RepID=UPI002ABB05A3|nr:hypothetical protein [Prosthecobacter sp.]MDZ4405910.1 hypothetical protein [Prosthecobacter sp.]
MSRLLPVTGLLAASLGGAWLVPAIVVWVGRGTLDRQGGAVVVIGVVLILSGIVALWGRLRRLRFDLIPAPVRAAIIGNGLFLAFCALEQSDGLVRAGGRAFYWTTVLFLPALVLFYGQVLAQRWAWWVARGMTALATLWFVVYLLVIPFVPLRGNDGPIPWWGRIYAAGVTLVFASVSAGVFRALGRAEARAFYGMAHET